MKLITRTSCYCACLFLGSIGRGIGTVNTRGDLPQVFDESTKKNCVMVVCLIPLGYFLLDSITGHCTCKPQSSGSIQCNCPAPGLI